MKHNNFLTHLLIILENVFFLILLFFFLVIVSPLLPSKQYLATYAVVSGSMEPTVPVGSLALVQAPDTSSLKVGDVITFAEPSNPKRTILHRITEINGSGSMTDIRTKGDNNQEADNWQVNARHVTGVMKTSLPLLGYPILFAQTPIGYCILVGIPALILSVIHIKNIIEGIREEWGKRSQTAQLITVPAR